MLSVFMCFYQNPVLVADFRVDCWQTLQCRLLWQIAGAQTDRKSNRSKKHSDMDNFICNQYGEKPTNLDT